MNFLLQAFYMLLLIGMGTGIIKYRKTVKSWTGEFLWAEKYLGRGGTYTAIIFFGIFLIFWGFTVPFGGLDMIFRSDNSAYTGGEIPTNSVNNIIN